MGTCTGANNEYEDIKNSKLKKAKQSNDRDIKSPINQIYYRYTVIKLKNVKSKNIMRVTNDELK